MGSLYIFVLFSKHQIDKKKREKQDTSYRWVFSQIGWILFKDKSQQMFHIQETKKINGNFKIILLTLYI